MGGGGGSFQADNNTDFIPVSSFIILTCPS